MTSYILEARDIVKTFPGVKALNCVHLNVKRGEVHAIVGENGAGKSTLMSVLGGVYKPDIGDIFIEGKKMSFNSASDANKNGITIVYQELSLVPNLSIAENIFANRQPLKVGNLINFKKLNEDARKMLALFNMDYIEPSTLVKDLSIANQQVVEILKAMSFNPKVLILDEPTSSLTDVEVKQLFRNIKMLKDKGISFIYISHHLQEIFEIADTVSVLRDGNYICQVPVKDINEEFLVTKMVGRKVENIYGTNSERDIGTVVFEAKNISSKGKFKNVSFTVKSGEILGLAGLIGAGRTEVARAIFGSESYDSGELYLEGKKLNIKSPKQAIDNGIGYMSEDRKSQGLYLNFKIKDNLISNRLKAFSKGVFIIEKKVIENAKTSVNKFGVATPSISQVIGNLSGGNQQKVLLASWVGIKPKVLIVDEPTRGVDVGAKSEIYTHLKNLAKEGVAIIMISSDLLEVINVSDRILVMKDGTVAGEVSKDAANEETVIAMATGVKGNMN
jgi:ABC-type sugar transport system ATPase subunit